MNVLDSVLPKRCHGCKDIIVGYRIQSHVTRVESVFPDFVYFHVRCVVAYRTGHFAAKGEGE